jgi:hypothetical protein
MEYLWTGNWPENRAPEIDSLSLNDQGHRENILLKPGKTYTARVIADDPDKDELKYEWEIYPENTEFGYAGHGETRPALVGGLFKDPFSDNPEFKAPPIAGNYRIFVYVRDPKSKIAIGNIPFHVK